VTCCRRCGCRTSEEFCEVCADIRRARITVRIREPRRDSWGSELEDSIVEALERGDHSAFFDEAYDPELEIR
jgi:hypothetical protein